MKIESLQSLLGKAREEIAQGNRKSAAQILIAILKQDSNYVEAWLLLADVLENPKHRIKCLKRALEINPVNVIAKKRLNELTEHEKGKAPGAKPNATTISVARTKQKSKTKRTVWMVGFLTLSIVCLCALIPFLGRSEISSTTFNEKRALEAVQNWKPPANQGLTCKETLDTVVNFYIYGLGISDANVNWSTTKQDNDTFIVRASLKGETGFANYGWRVEFPNQKITLLNETDNELSLCKP